MAEDRMKFVERADWPDVEAAIADYRAGRDVRHPQALARYERIAPPWGAGKALDLGTGRGQGALILRSKGWHVTAVDIDPEPAELLARNGAGFTRADVTAWVPPGCYDLITCMEVLEHIEDPAALLAEITQWLSPGGRLEVTIPLETKPNGNPWHKHFWTKETILKLLNEYFIVLAEHPAVNHATIWATLRPRPAKLATVSLDDGGWQDIAVCEALRAEGLPATFYLVSTWVDEPHYHIPVARIVGAYEGFEIGCHTRTHADMRYVSPAGAALEAVGAQAELQRIFGRDVSLFSWPKGAVHADALPPVREHFAWARGVRRTGVANRWDTMVSAVCPRVPPAAVLAGRPCVHVVGHAWSLRDRGMLQQFLTLLYDLRDAGFEFVANGEFFAIADKCGGKILAAG